MSTTALPANSADPPAAAAGRPADSAVGVTSPAAVVVETAGAQPSRTGTPKILIALAILAACWFVLYGQNQLQDIAGPLLLVVNLMIISTPCRGGWTAGACRGRWARWPRR